MTSDSTQQSSYDEPESLTLQLLCKLIRDSLESGEATTASLLGTAVSMLRAGGVQQQSTQAQRESSNTAASWFHDLPEEAKAKLREGPAGDYVDRVTDVEED